jgi:capsular polysaccharide biosynthesis protein
VDLRQFLGILRVRWKFIIVTIGFGALITTLLILWLPKSYASTASLFISTPSTGVADTYSATLTAGQRAESYATLARDPEVLARVAQRLDIKRTPSQLADQISTTVVETTLLLRVGVVARARAADRLGRVRRDRPPGQEPRDSE